MVEGAVQGREESGFGFSLQDLWTGWLCVSYRESECRRTRGRILPKEESCTLDLKNRVSVILGANLPGTGVGQVRPK